jgi:DNA polymerase III epsilon subunit-like protein
VLHKRVADTAILYPHLQSEAHKNSLKFLALKFLREEVQSGSHDSIQDAVTALKLFLLKVKHGHVRVLCKSFLFFPFFRLVAFAYSLVVRNLALGIMETRKRTS